MKNPSVTLLCLVLFGGLSGCQSTPPASNGTDSVQSDQITIAWKYGDSYPEMNDDIHFYVDTTFVGEGQTGREAVLKRMKDMPNKSKIILDRSHSPSKAVGMGGPAFDPYLPGAEEEYMELIGEKQFILLIE